MKKHLSKVILGTQLLASLFALGAIYIWAPVCDGMLTLANGNLTHMKCFYTAQASAGLALILLVAAIMAFRSKTDHNQMQWVIMVIGMMLIANTITSVLGIGICKNPAMACHDTAVWLRGSGLLAVGSGFAGILADSGKKNKITL